MLSESGTIGLLQPRERELPLRVSRTHLPVRPVRRAAPPSAARAAPVATVKLKSPP